MLSNSEPLPEGTVIMAEDQFAGRGQQDNIWHSEPGKNLTFSLLLQPGFLIPDEQFKLNMAISVALHEALKGLTGEGLSVKWPNDIYFRDKKIGGILIENIISGRKIKNSVVGIGINVNQQHFKEGVSGNAGSIYQILHQDVNLIQLLAEICSQIEVAYLKLRAGSYTELRSVYVGLLYQYKVKARYRYGGEIIEGEIVDVGERGLLSIKTRIGITTYNFKEIEFIKPQNT
ncbi:biotin--[acetyl-CoA-carboxylase] ligase [Pedobacter sp. AW31-3R]|uniref:biotin--[acetyl-CoA-carboxylase] ligase n=1 Tax=Pedobacter sp. AW31-3R TaxID=3445781 RepID=UPI003FA18E8E